MIYSNLKIFHYKNKLDSLLTNDILPPIHVRIKPTNRCNHNCWYCAYRQDNLQLGRDMKQTDSIPKEKILEIIDDLDEMEIEAITFSGGGEPLCYPYILDAIYKLITTPVKFALLTNGSKLRGEVADVIRQRGTWVRVSMDGWDDASYTRFRKVPYGEFTKIINNMRIFKKMDGECYLGVSLIITGENISYMYDTISLLKDVGVDNVKISPCIVSNDAEENNQYYLPFYNRAQCEIESVMSLVDDTFQVVDSYHLMDEKFQKDYRWCPYLQILPVIGADLNVYSCQDKAYNLDTGLLGSIKDKSFKDFWFDGKEKFFKINPSVHCNHHCVSNTKNKMILEYLDVEHGEFV